MKVHDPRLTESSRAHSGGHLVSMAWLWDAGMRRLQSMHLMLVTELDVFVDRVGLLLLLLASGALLVRPADLFPALQGAPIYEVLVVGCLLLSLPRLVAAIGTGSPFRNGVAALNLLLVPAVMLSHLWHMNTYDARMGGVEMAKACSLFLLVLVLVDSPRKLVAMLLTAIAAVFIVTVLAVLQHRGAINLPALQPPAGSWSEFDSAESIRLYGVGVFNDPNDFAMLLVTAAIACLFALGERRAGFARWILVAPLSLFGYALMLTQSRGGLLSAGGAFLAFLMARIGWRNAVPLACLLFPLLLAFFSGRQTTVDMDNPEDTFQTRIGLWSDSLEVFRSSPMLGIGQGKLVDVIGHVTHNSYLHAFAELGLFGGMAFVGVFYLLIRGLLLAAPVNRDLARMRPFMLASTVGYATGLLSLSRCYTVPTQMMFALATVYLMLGSRSGSEALPRLDGACIRRVAGVGIVVLVATYVFVRIVVQRG